jgi:hypothetical protein
MTQHLERSRRPLGPIRRPQATTAELYQASTALAIPLLRTLATPPLINRIDALGDYADTEPYPALSVHLLIQCEISFQTSVFAIVDNKALTYLSARLYEQLARSLPGFAISAASEGPDSLPYPRLRQIVDLVGSGEGDKAVRLAHHRADRIYALVFGGHHHPHPVLIAASAVGKSRSEVQRRLV